MKKIFILVSIILLFLILPYCKTAEETSKEVPSEQKSVGIWDLSGSGTYDSTKNESTLKFSITVRNQVGVAENNIIDWRIKLFVKGEFLLEINQDNYKTITSDCAYAQIDQPNHQDPNIRTAMGYVSVFAYVNPYSARSRFPSSGKPIPGDFFKGKNPDSLEAIITIKAATGYIYEDSRIGDNYTFSRS